MFVWLTQSFFNALVFPYLVVISYFNDLLSFAFIPKIFLSFYFRICECKSNNLFLIDQMFLKKILKFFLISLKPLQNLNHCYSALPIFGTAKILIFFNSTTFNYKNLESFFSVSNKVILYYYRYYISSSALPTNSRFQCRKDTYYLSLYTNLFNLKFTFS